jgi:DNA (cytosine-5)-methyltransferase 1
MKKCTHNLKAVDFFCGAGGMTEGFEKAGIRVLAGIDIDHDCKETYEKNHPRSLFIESDIKRLSVEALKKTLNLRINDPTLIMIGCSPCQHWSKINTERQKSEGSKNLLEDFTRFVKYFNPGYIVIENVPGIDRHPEESGLSKFLEFLKANGYSFVKDIVNMCCYGIPQKRVRFLLIAAKGSKKPAIPHKNTAKPSVMDIIFDLPPIGAGEQSPRYNLHRAAVLSEKNLKRISLTPPNGGTRAAWKDDPELQIPAYRGKDAIFRDVYGRMAWDKAAPTITTRFNSLSNGRFGHPDQNRAISLMEGALLQSFSRGYKFINDHDVVIARQIGNAVPPKFAKLVASRIICHYEQSAPENP